MVKAVNVDWSIDKTGTGAATQVPVKVTVAEVAPVPLFEHNMVPGVAPSTVGKN